MNCSPKSISLVGLVSILGSLAGAASAAAPASNPQLTVRLYDYAAVPVRTLAEAKHVSSEIFRAAGITLLWVECSSVENKSSGVEDCEHVSDPLRLVLRIVPESMEAQLHRPRRVFGMAVHSDAFIFYGRIETFSAMEGVSETVILGHAMAHELGHMVLGQTRHSPNGIMMETYRKEALRRAEKGQLLFTPQQAADMRSRLGAQTVAQSECRNPGSRLATSLSITA
jgi:hypothetical protein